MTARRHLLVGFLVAVSLVAGCAKADQDRSATSSGSGSGSNQASTTTSSSEDFVAQADDFVNLADMTAVRDFFVDNRSGHLAEAVAIARDGGTGTYPVGTIIQLIPQEAMVKRRAGFDPGSNDWEFFELDISEEGTTIHQRGGAEIVNRFGSGSCSSCHSAAEPEYDFVCEDDHGCEPLPVSDEFIDDLQANDIRPRA